MDTGRRRKRAPRFIEIANEAGVSPSTVDRVLNERGSDFFFAMTVPFAIVRPKQGLKRY